MAEVSAVQSDPNFAIVCSFIDRHGSLLNLPDISFEALQRCIDETRFIPNRLKDVLLLLLRKWKRSMKTDKWERTLIMFCFTYSQIDAWELERFGFARCKVSTKLRILKNLLERQFDCNSKFKEKINEKRAEELRFLPVGRDKNGLTYWFLLDRELNVVVYREEHDDVESESWQRVVCSREELACLVDKLGAGDSEDGKSGSVTPAVTGSGASSDVEAKEPIKPEVKEEDSASGKDDLKTEPRQDATPASVKEEPPDDGLRREAGKEREDEGAASQKLEAAIKIETKEEKKEAAGKGGKVEGEGKESAIVKGKNGKDGDGSEESATVKTDDEHRSQEIHVAALSSCDDEKNVVLRATDKKRDKEGSCNLTSTEKENTCVTGVEVGPHGNSSLSSNKDTSVDANRINDDPSEKLGDRLSRDDSSEVKQKDISEKSDSRLRAQSQGRVDGNCAENSVSKNKHDDKETSQNKCGTSVKQEKQDKKVEKQGSVPEKQDSLQEKEENLEGKQDCLREKQDRLQEKQDKVHEKQDSVEEKQDNLKETQDNVHAKSDSGSAKPDAKEGNKNEINAHDVSHTAGDTSDGETTERLTPMGTASSNVCVGESRKEAGKIREEGEKNDGRLPHMRKRLRRSKQDDRSKKDASDSSPLSSDSDVVPSNNSSSDGPPSKRQRAKRKRKATRGSRQKTVATDSKGDCHKTAVDSTEEEGGKVDQAKTKIAVDDGNQDNHCATKRGRKAKCPVIAVDSAENSCDSPAPLRRSSRANRGQRTLLQFGLESSKKRRGDKKDVDTDEGEVKKGKQLPEEDEEEEEEVMVSVSGPKKGKKKRRGRGEEDEEFVPMGKKQKKKRRQVSRDMSTDDDDDEFMRDLDEAEEESLHWSSPATSSVGEEDEDRSTEEYRATGRNAQRSAALKEKGMEEDDSTNCTHCGKASHPQLILLCDQCNIGYHTACLRPPLMLIPDGDWFCPACEQSLLLGHLRSELAALDVLLKKNDRLVKRKERLAFVGISLDNILTNEGLVYEAGGGEDYGQGAEETDEEGQIEARRVRRENQRRERRRERRDRERRRHKLRLREDVWEDEETEEEKTESESEEEKKGWLAERRLRRCTEQISYKFEEYDELIRTAIREDVIEYAPQDTSLAPGFGKDIYNATLHNDAINATMAPTTCGRGKDIDNNTDTEEPAVKSPSPQPPRVGMGKDIDNASDAGEGEDCRPRPVLEKKKKKSRRLTGLSDDDEEEEDSGEEYQATDESPDSDANDLEAVTDSDDWTTSGKKRRRRRKGQRSGTRRSSRRRRAASRYDDDFVDDEDSDRDSDLDSDEFLPVRRAVVKTSINYREISDSEPCSEYGSDASSSRRKKRRKSAVVSSDGDTDGGKASRGRRRSKAADSDYHLSSDSGKSGSYRCRDSRRPRDSDGSRSGSDREETKKKKRRNVIESSEDDGDDDRKSEKGSGEGSGESSGEGKTESASDRKKEDSSDRTENNGGEVTEGVKGQPCNEVVEAEVKGQPSNEVAEEVKGQPGNKVAAEGGWRSRSGSFMIENLLKESGTVVTNTATAGLVDNAVAIDNHDDDDLSGVDDLVDFVTNE